MFVRIDDNISENEHCLWKCILCTESTSSTWSYLECSEINIFCFSNMESGHVSNKKTRRTCGWIRAFILYSQVSWVRRRGDELNLITFGRHTYSSDSRYSLEYMEPNDWQLMIQYANERDEGHYECQVSVHPPMVLLIYLTVVGELIVMIPNNMMIGIRETWMYRNGQAEKLSMNSERAKYDELIIQRTFHPLPDYGIRLALQRATLLYHRNAFPFRMIRCVICYYK